MRMRRPRRSQRRVPRRFEYRRVRLPLYAYLVVADMHPPTDLTELDLPSTMKTHFPDPADLLNFTLTITPDEGTLSSNIYLPLTGLSICTY